MPPTRVRVSRVLPLLLLCACLLPLIHPAAPAAGQPAAIPDNPERQLTLTITAPTEEVAWGEAAAVTLVVANPGATAVEGVALHLPRGRGLSWEDETDGSGGPWLELGDLPAGESRTVAGQLRVAGVSRSGQLAFHVGLYGREVEAVRQKGVVHTPPPARETADIAAAGGEARLAGGRARLVFPPGWNERAARLGFQVEELYWQAPDETGRLLLFAVEAAGAAEPFDAPVTVELAVGDLLAGATPGVTTRADDSQPWTAVESAFDPATGMLRFQAEHFSSYQVATEPEVWKLLYNPPGASAYSGAATYSYPLQLPPGIAGLAPDLSLNYSSRPAEGMEAPAIGQGFGVGWSLPTAQINNGNSGGMYVDGGPCCNDYHTYSFTLTLNGVTYYLSPLTADARGYGGYRAAGGPELKIEFIKDDNANNNTDNVTGEFWQVRTADGTTYTFGRTEDAEQIVWPVDTLDLRNGNQLRNKSFSAYNWKLNSITDVHGNWVKYVYETACGEQWTSTPGNPKYREGDLAGGGKACTEVDTGLKEIRYNYNGTTPQTVVTFTNERMNKNQARQEKSMTAGVFRPTQIEVRQGGTVVSRDTFTYAGDAHYWSAWDVSTDYWMLTGVTHAGSDGKTLPAQTFAYEQDANACLDGECVRLLTRVDNGYGAVTTIGYAQMSGTEWRYAATVDTWDGVAAQYPATRPRTRTRYTPSTGRIDNIAQVCYDKAYDKEDNPCHSRVWLGESEGSKALIGFTFTMVETQEPLGADGWKTLSKQELTFYNDLYWLLGKVDLEERFDESGAKLQRSDYAWMEQVAGEGYVILDWEAHATYQPGDESRYVSHTIDYTYYPLNTAGGQYGALKWRQEKDEQGANYRCTEYEYAQRADVWLINRPTRQTLKAGNCSNGSVMAETRYRYANSANPSDVGLDARGLLTYVLQWAGGTNYATEKRTYTANGLPMVVTTFSDLSTTTQYASQGRQTVTTTYTALGLPQTVTTRAVAQDVYEQTQTIGYNTTFPWLVASISDANAIVTRYGYDGFGRLTKVAMPGDTLTDAGATVRYAYYDTGSPLFIKPFLVGIFYKNNARSVERQFYDGLGRLVQTQTAAAEVEGETGDRDLIVSLAYDARGLEVCRSVPYDVAAYQQSANSPFRPEACAAQTRTTTTYDALSRPLSVTTPDGASVITNYWVKKNTTVDGHTTLAAADVRDGNGHQVTRLSDAFGRLVLVRDYEGAWENYTPYADTRYSYNVLDNLMAVGTSAARDAQPTSFLRETRMTYDPLGRKTTLIDPDMGTWNYTYDAAGNLTRQTQPGASADERQALCFYYDSFNRLLRRTQDDELDKLADSCPAYSASPASGEHHLASYRYGAYLPAYNNGRLVEVNWGTTPAQNYDTFTYDAEGRLASQTRRLDNQPFTYQVTKYDVLDRPENVTLPNGQTVVIAYDEEGENKLTVDGKPLIDKVGYNERGQLALLSRPGAAPETTLTYHDATVNFRLNKLLHGPEGGALPDFIYGATHYDEVGNLLGMQMKVNATTENYGFGYDALNRLTTAALTGAGSASYDYGYTYDPLGNLMTRTLPDGSDGGTERDVDMSYTYGTFSGSPPAPVLPQAVTWVHHSTGVDWGFAYDARGNLAGKYVNGVQTYDYTFDVESRLESVTTNNQTTTFAYDPDGQRVKTVRPDGTVIYTPFPDYEVEDPPGGGANTVRTTYRLAGQIVAVQTKVGTAAGAFYYTYTDHLGNVVALSNATGGYIANSLARYDPFGNYRTEPTTNPGVTNHGFTGHRHNNTGAYATQDIGLIYMNARHYLPEVGRFISPDTIVPEPGNPQSYNRYSYALNSPLNFTDPTGHMHDAGDRYGSGSPDVVTSYSPAPGYAYTLYAVPFTPTSGSDPRVAELRPIVCTPASGCQTVSSVVPAYLASTSSNPGDNAVRSEGQEKMGQALSAAATGIDMLSTTISGSALLTQFAATTAFGPTGLDDLVAHGAYPVAIDAFENATSILAALTVAAADFSSGASDIATLGPQVVIGQDTLVVGIAAAVGQLAGKPPLAGPALDTAINLVVNYYDFRRLSGSIPSIVEMRFVEFREVYVVFYP